MTAITLRVLDGADRGKIFENLNVPVTIGREEGNSIQLNDERISRFHLKIQQDHDDIVLTDLDSTNGCKVNNEEVHLRILRHGDLITVGRSTLLFGNRQQIKRRLKALNSRGSRKPAPKPNDENSPDKSSSSEVIIGDDWRDNPHYQLELLDIDPPKLPDRLSPGQAAKLAEVIEYLHIHLRRVISEIEIDGRRQTVELPLQQWQHLVDLQSRLAEYLRQVESPPAPS
jgi:pSer/pThr/pTyr-binding forkhead associated (FHA) protein